MQEESEDTQGDILCSRLLLKRQASCPFMKYGGQKARACWLAYFAPAPLLSSLPAPPSLPPPSSLNQTVFL